MKTLGRVRSQGTRVIAIKKSGKRWSTSTKRIVCFIVPIYEAREKSKTRRRGRNG